MTTTKSGLVALVIVLGALNVAPSASPQESGKSASETRPSASKESPSGVRSPEAEFVGSPSFRSATLVQPLWRDLNAEGHHFGGDESNIGFTGGSWTFQEGSWKLAPGFGVLFGDNKFQTMPGLSVRWGFEHNWFVTEGLLVRGLFHTSFVYEGAALEANESADKSVVPWIADGNHVSARWKRLTAGGTWERMQFREGREWKGGLRLAYKVLPSLSFTFFAMGPGSEIRGGVLFQREVKK
jgi:hypothetical protein